MLDSMPMVITTRTIRRAWPDYWRASTSSGSKSN